MVERPPYRGRVLRTIVGRDFDGNIEIGEYVVRILASHGFGREAFFSGCPAHDEAGVGTGDQDNFVLPVSSVVLHLGMSEYFRAYGRERPSWNRMRGKFSLR